MRLVCEVARAGKNVEEPRLDERREVRREPEPGTVADNLTRLSVGLEHPEDLWRDLEAALAEIDPVSLES